MATRNKIRKLTTEYLLNVEESVDRVVDELETLNKREVSKVVFSAFSTAGDRAYPYRVYMLVSKLISQDNDHWSRVFSKAIRPRGRAIPYHRKPIRLAIVGRPFEIPRKRETTKPETKEVTTKKKIGQTISIREFDTSIKDYTRLLNYLGSDECKNATEFTLDFESVNHTYVFGLAILAAFLRQQNATFSIVNTGFETNRYLDRIGFNHAIAGEDTSPYEDQRGWAVKLTPVTDTTEAETVSGQLVEIFDHQLKLSASQNQALYVVMSETVENVLRHGEITSPAFVCAQVYPTQRKLSIAIVDAGIGFRQSFLRGDNHYAIRRIVEQGDEPIDLAVEPLQTSKTKRHAGYGLFVVRELAGHNGGHIKISSEGVSITYVRRKRTLKRSKFLHKPWFGSIVCLLFDLNNELDLEGVYSQLPSPRGYEEEDFFE